MKTLILTVLLASKLFAAGPITGIEEDKILIGIAKNLRKELWKKRHIDVESETKLFDEVSLKNYLSDKSFYQHVKNKQAKEATACVENEDCTLYQISVSSSFHSGYMIDGHLVLLDLNTGDFKVYSHNIYGE